MSMGKYEKDLIDVLEKNPNINTRKYIKLADIGRTTFYKYANLLESKGYISYEEIKNEKVWYLMRKKKNDDWGMMNFEESKKLIESRFDKLESKIFQAIRKAKKGTVNDKVVGYGDSVLLLLSILGLLKLVSHYRENRVPDVDVQFVKKVEKLLEKITDKKFNNQHGYGRLSIDSVIRETENRLDKFLGIEKPQIRYV